MLTRRNVLGTLAAILIPGWAVAQQGALKPFRFRVRTASGSVVNTTIMARDQFEAVHKIQQRYKGCEILNLYPPRKETVKKEPQRKRR